MQEVGTTPWLGFIDALSNSIVVTVLVVSGPFCHRVWWGRLARFVSVVANQPFC